MKLTIPLVVALLVVVPACKGKDDQSTGSTAGTAAGKPPPACRPGELIAGDACVAVVTDAAVKAVAAEADRIDALTQVLDDVSTVAAPIELMKAFRDLAAWKQMVTLVPELARAEAVIDTLDRSVKQLTAFRASLGDVRARLGNVGKELASIYAATGTQRKVDEVRAIISREVAAATESFDGAARELVAQVITPTLAQLVDVSDIVDGACALGKLKGGSADFVTLCGQAKAVFGPARTYLDGLRTQPSALLKELAAVLATQLDALLDQTTKTGLAALQARVDAAVKGP